MKKLLLTLFIGLISFAYANVNVVVSILPQKTFVEAIGGDKVNVSLMVKPGNSPHSYEPKPSQMKNIAKADIYFAMGVEFEHAWLVKFKNQNKKMDIIHLDKGISKIKIEAHSHNDHNDRHEHENLDPHIWTSPSNVKIIAKNIYKALVSKDQEKASYYKANYEKFLKHIKNTDKQIKTILINLDTNSKFMVFHPAWGYFAKDYGLTQLAIEAGGKNPKPKQVMHLIYEAKKEGVKAVFTAPEFSEKVAKQIAKEVGVPVVKISPLNPKWSQNLIKLAKAIANK